MSSELVAFTVADVRRQRVVCSVERWNHAAQHAELANHLPAVEEAIKQPMAIYQSAVHIRREVYYSPSTALQPPYDRGYIAVVVEFDRNRQGSLITAFHALGPKHGEVLIWP